VYYGGPLRDDLARVPTEYINAECITKYGKASNLGTLQKCAEWMKYTQPSGAKYFILYTHIGGIDCYACGNGSTWYDGNLTKHAVDNDFINHGEARTTYKLEDDRDAKRTIASGTNIYKIPYQLDSNYIMIHPNSDCYGEDID
jgi:hypothetical protein